MKENKFNCPCNWNHNNCPIRNNISSQLKNTLEPQNELLKNDFNEIHQFIRNRFNLPEIKEDEHATICYLDKYRYSPSYYINLYLHKDKILLYVDKNSAIKFEKGKKITFRSLIRERDVSVWEFKKHLNDFLSHSGITAEIYKR